MDRLFTAFPKTKQDGLLLNWAHRTNTPSLLQAALENSNIHCIEADIRHNPEDASQEAIAYIAHDIAAIAENHFTLLDFLDQFFANAYSARKGLKLDFKSIQSVRYAFESFDTNRVQALRNLPLFLLNADIVGSDAEPIPLVEPNEFLQLCAKYFPTTMLSVGFSVPQPAATGASYTQEMVEKMQLLLARHNPSVEVTFPLRIGYLPASLDAILWLVGQKPSHYSATLWHSTGDGVNELLIDAVGKLRKALLPTQLLYDLPTEMTQMLRERLL